MICWDMYRLFTRLMLALLPLYFLWAGAALACQHEPNANAVHFGHHAAAKSQADQNGDTKLPAAGGDCSVCHLASSQLAFADVVVMLVGDKDTPPLGAAPRPTMLRPDLPDRPNWRTPS